MKAVLAAGERAASPSWGWGNVLQAPHRLGFLLAMVVLAASGLWWAAVQLDRVGAGLLPPFALSPSLVHSAVMAFGFMPLFFCGFLFTAGPRWLGVEGPSARQVQPVLLALAAGWLLWLAGAHVHAWLALAGLALATAALAGVSLRFWGLVRASTVPDRLHAKTIGAALAAGVALQAALLIAVAADQHGAARALVVSGLWAFIVVVYVSVAHRMIPFFTATALPGLAAWRPVPVLGLMLGTAGFEAAAVWLEAPFGMHPAWLVTRGLIELAAGLVLLWLAFAWGLIQSLRIRLLAMLHLGFCWLGFALALSGASQLLAAATAVPLMPLAPLHALTMGCLGSLMIAMVTRVSCGHSGRALGADNLVWALFWLLQAAVLLRIVAAAGPAASWFLAAAAVLWAGVTFIWGVRYGNWYGRPRADGRPG
jgi:uncharacterized protein involved in response to NO